MSKRKVKDMAKAISLSSASITGAMAAAGYGLDGFKRLVSISSFVSIKALVGSGIGISFLYRSVVENEPDIGTFTVDGITEPHPFHVVYTQGTNAKNYARQFLAGTDGPG